jgi:ketosteroid isomerase-like protein
MATAEQNKDVIRRAVAALGRGDIDGFLADTTDDFDITVMGTPPGGSTLSGKQNVIRILKKVFGSKIVNSAIAMTIDNFITEDEFVVEQARGKAKTLDGRDYNNSYCRVWRVVDGKIRSLNEYMDTELARACLWT